MAAPPFGATVVGLRWPKLFSFSYSPGSGGSRAVCGSRAL
jgi:hypothetical protein